MSRIDVRELKKENLPEGKFPGDAPADFRLYLAPQVHQGIGEHARKNVTVEICGVLVGRWQTDAEGPFAVVTDLIRCENASSKFAEVTFTHESWAHINKEMDTRFADQRIIGWYHSHPDFGIFLSERDGFIHEHFFSGPGQVAYVVDPVRDLEGAFAWRNGKPELLPLFWVGNTIRTSDARRHSSAQSSDRQGSMLPPGGDSAIGTAAPVATSAQPSFLGPLATVLAGLAAFVLGYFYGGFRSNLDRQMIAEGVVSSFADLKILHEGLEANLATVRQRLESITNELRELPETSAGLPAAEAEALALRRKQLLELLDERSGELEVLEQTYGLSDFERAALSRWVAERKALMRRPPPRKADDKTPAADSASGGPEGAAPSKPLPAPNVPPKNAADSQATDTPTSRTE